MRLVVVGAGITGLAAAFEWRVRRPDDEIVVLEAGDRIGGKLHRIELAGHWYDTGPEAMLARVPDAVAEVEDVPAGRAALLDHPAHLPVDGGAVGQQHGRVEVALQRAVRSHAAGSLVERHPPVHADDVGPRGADQRQQLTGADAEVDPRDVAVP